MGQVNLPKTNRLDLVIPAANKVGFSVDENGIPVIIDENEDITELYSRFWTKITLNYSDWSGAVTYGLISLTTIPAGYQINKIIIKHTVAFAGTSITNATVAIWDESETYTVGSVHDVFQTVGDTVGAIRSMDEQDWLIDITSGSAVKALLNLSGGGTLNDLTQGSVDFYLLVDKVNII